MFKRLLLAALLAALALPAAAERLQVPDPAPRDTCPVCGMFVARYPEWVATIVYKDGHAHHFDGAKDMFKFYFEPPRYAPGHHVQDIAQVAVTDYYTLDRVDAHSAWYVVGSDVLGPMGHELIPHELREDAEAFLKDHGGVRILSFGEVSKALVEDLDRGAFPAPR